MPRTKRPVKKVNVVPPVTESSEEDRKALKLKMLDIDEQFARMMRGLERLYEEKVLAFEHAFSIIKMDISPAMMDMVPVDEDEDVCDAMTEAESMEMSSAVSEMSSAVLEMSSAVTEVSDFDASNTFKMPPRRVTRSQGQGRMMIPPARPDRFRTPNCNLAPGGNRYNMITPKVQPNSSISVLRRPQEGEIAFALSGSPLLVSTRGGDDVANVNIPLAGGKVLSILPQSGLRPQDMPEVDDDVMRQLQKLRDNINCLLGGR